MENTFFDELKDIGFFAKLCIIGTIGMIIYSLFALFTSYDIILLILSIVILILSTQLEEENDYSIIFALSIEIIFFFLNFYVSYPLGLDIPSWIGYIGYRFTDVIVSIYIFLIVLDLVMFESDIPFTKNVLMMIGIGLFVVHFVFSLLPGLLYRGNIIPILIYICMFAGGLVLIKLRQPLIGAFVIWFGSISNSFSLSFNFAVIAIVIVLGLCVFAKKWPILGVVAAFFVVMIILDVFSVPITSGISGFGAGSTIIAYASLLWVIEEVMRD